MRRRRALFALAGCSSLAMALLPSACSDFDPPSSTPDDAGAAFDATTNDAPLDAGDASEADGPFVPAAHIPYPTLSYGGGPVLGPPRFVVATFPGDPQAADVNGFVSAIPSSEWWREVNQGACDDAGCVGDVPDSGADVRTVVFDGDAAATYAQADVANLLHQAIASGKVPAPDANTMYILSFPIFTTLTSLPTATGAPQGTGCTTFLEYHRQLYIGDLALEAGVPDRVPFVALPRCSRTPSDVSVPLARGLVAAAQDPNGQAYVLRGPNGWNTYFGSEAPDICSTLAPVVADGITLPRVWSNDASVSGDPCVPSDGQTYFAVAPHTAGDLYIGIDETATIPLDVFSDGPTAPFELEAADLDEILTATPTLKVTLDQKTGVNGDHPNATVHFDVGPGERGYAVVIFFAIQDKTVHAWPVAVHAI